MDKQVSSISGYNHGISFDDAYDIFDAWLADGHVMTDFIAVILDIYKASGIMASTKEKTEKN